MHAGSTLLTFPQPIDIDQVAATSRTVRSMMYWSHLPSLPHADKAGNEEGDGAKFENRRGLHCNDTHCCVTLLTGSEKHFRAGDIVTSPWFQALQRASS